MLDTVIAIPGVMAASFVVILVVGKRLSSGQGAHYVGIPAVFAAWVMSLVTAARWIDRVHGAEEGGEEGGHALGAFFGWFGAILPGVEEGEGHGAVVEPVINRIVWWQSGGTEFHVGTHLDGLSAILLVVVTTVSLLVHVYSVEYVRGDRRYTHYYAFLSLFTAAMLFFVLTENIIQLIVGWELVGLCSFVLIGHWWEEGANTNAALKAFLTNRVGDIGLLVGMIVLYFAVVDSGHNTFSIAEINGFAVDGELSHGLLLVASIALMAAVASKSGQFPLHTWLPDAMAGPTPVSALIHAATMVVAGVYMIARLYPVFYDGFSIDAGGVNLMAVVGCVTLLGGGLLAFVQWDIKKILAYSTVSQLGYMVMALGVGAWTPAIFHLFTHAFFKACLFLGAGSVSHAAHHTFDMRQMGGLRKYMPVTFITFVVASLALAGVVPLAGFWSKDEILLTAGENGYEVFEWLGLLGGGLTAAYMTRAVYYTFFGRYRGHGTPHESPALMTGPLVVLGVLAATAGFVNATADFPDTEYLVEFVEPTAAFPALDHPEFSYGAAAIATLVALGAIALTAAWFFGGVGERARVGERFAPARLGRRVLENKYYLDWLYTDVVVAGTKGPLARAADWINQNVIDRFVDTVGTGSRSTGDAVYKYIDQGLVDGAVRGAGSAAGGSGEALRHVQSGRVQQYGSLLFGAAAVLAILLVIVV